MKIGFLTLAAVAINSASAFVAPQGAVRDVTSLNAIADYADELKATAKNLVRPGRGLLACDESNGTVGTRLEGIGMENIEENRRDVSYCLDILCSCLLKIENIQLVHI